MKIWNYAVTDCTWLYVFHILKKIALHNYGVEIFTQPCGIYTLAITNSVTYKRPI